MSQRNYKIGYENDKHGSDSTSGTVRPYQLDNDCLTQNKEQYKYARGLRYVRAKCVLCTSKLQKVKTLPALIAQLICKMSVCKYVIRYHNIRLDSFVNLQIKT